MDPLNILSLIDLGSSIAVNLVNLAGDVVGDAMSLIGPYLPHP